MNKKTVAVLLTVFNRRDVTIAGLTSLHDAISHVSDCFSFDVFMTDDGSTDGTTDAVISKFPQTRIIHGNGSLYWCGGMRLAWSAALESSMTYDYFLWFNDDTILYDSAIRLLLEESGRHDDKCIVVGTTRFENYAVASYGGYLHNKIVTPVGKSVKVDYFNGNVVLIPHYVFQRVGNLDSFYTHGHGDTDYGLRAGKKRIESYVVGEYVGECDRHETPKKCWNPNVSLFQRFMNLYHPTGYPPHEAFYYEMKHKNIVVAMFHFVTLHLRVLFPALWIRMGKARI